MMQPCGCAFDRNMLIAVNQQTTNQTNKLPTMSLEKAFQLYPEVFAEIYILGENAAKKVVAEKKGPSK
jgi:hypothetical protein